MDFSREWTREGIGDDEPSMPSDDLIQQIKAALQAATPGPWADSDQGYGCEVRSQHGSPVAWCGKTSAHQDHVANAALIVLLRNHAAELVARVEDETL